MHDREEKLRRAAIVVLTLDESTADKVLAQLPEDDVARLRQIMVDMEVIDQAEERRALGEFLRYRPMTPPRFDAGVELSLSSDNVGSAASAPSPPKPTQEKTYFQFLQAARGDKITPFIAGEHPQTIAVVLSHMPDNRAAAVLAQLDGDLQADVIRRLIDLDQTDPEVVRDVELALETRMLEQALAERRQDTGMESMSRILQAADPESRRAIIANLSRRDTELAERFCPPEIEFEDLRYFDDATLSEVLSAAGADVARLAMAGAESELVDRILASFSPAEAKKMRRVIERIGPIRLSDVEEAQREVARVARQLAIEGKIELPRMNGAMALMQ